MTKFTDIDFYNSLVKKYSPPAYQHFPTADQLDYWRPRLPELLIRYWKEEGWGSLSKGQYWTCDPDYLRPVMEQVFAGDPQYSADNLISFGYNALGVIDVAMGQGRSMTIDLIFGTVTWRGLNKEFPESEFLAVYYNGINAGAYSLDWKDEDGIQIFPWALEHLGELQPGEIYGFTPAYSVPPHRYPVKNLSKQPVIEHLVMLASLSPPTLYDYAKPEGEEGGFGTLVPVRKVGRQP